MIRVPVPPPPRCWWMPPVLIVLLLMPVDVQADPTKFLTGQMLSEALNRPVGFEISGDSRRDALRIISNQFGIAIFLDRRIDPDVPLS